jgi:hypothetical protein
MLKIHAPTLCRIAFIGALCVPLLATAADVTAAPSAASSSAAKKVTKAAKAKTGGGNSAPGCDESNTSGKKGPSLPKCPEIANKKATSQQ